MTSPCSSDMSAKRDHSSGSGGAVIRVIQWLKLFMRYNRGYTVVETFYALQQGLYTTVQWLKLFMRCNRGYTVVETFCNRGYTVVEAFYTLQQGL